MVNLVMQVSATQYHQRRYFLKDQLGSVRTTVDQNGNVDGYDDYYPFGLAMPYRSFKEAGNDHNYRFTGHERDDEAEITLDYMMARNYDPIIGRFLQVDPLAKKFPNLSPYVYVANNPLSYTDPTGMACEPDCNIYSAAENAGINLPTSGEIFEAQMNVAKSYVKATFNTFKAKAVSMYIDFGVKNSKSMSLSEKIDYASISGEITVSEDGTSYEASGMFLSAGFNTDSEGETETTLGIAGLGSINPETGSFDASIPLKAGHINLGRNTETGDSKIGGGFGIKNFAALGMNLIFNMGENIQESKQMIQNSESQLNNVMSFDFKDE